MSDYTKNFEAMLKRMSESWDRGNIDAALTVSRIFRVRENFYDEARPVMAQYDLSPAEFGALASLRKYGEYFEMTPSGICQANMLSSGGLTKVLNNLEERGYVTRKVHERDQRSRVVKLTKKGQALIEEAMALAFEKHEQTIAKALTRKERQELDRLLVKLNSVAGG